MVVVLQDARPAISTVEGPVRLQEAILVAVPVEGFKDMGRRWPPRNVRPWFRDIARVHPPAAAKQPLGPSSTSGFDRVGHLRFHILVQNSLQAQARATLPILLLGLRSTRFRLSDFLHRHIPVHHLA